MAAERVVVLGSGSWGSVIARQVASTLSGRSVPGVACTVVLWLYEEQLSDGTMLSDCIRRMRRNVKYLPGHDLPPNVEVSTDLTESCVGATLLVFVTPHQFLPGMLPGVVAGLRTGRHADQPLPPRVKAVSLIKGLTVVEGRSGGGEGGQGGGLLLPSDTIRDGLRGVNAGRIACACTHSGVGGHGQQRVLPAAAPPTRAQPDPRVACACPHDDVDVCVLMGANVADEVADGQYCEATLGFDGPLTCPSSCACARCGASACTSRGHADLWVSLLSTPSFSLAACPDWPTVELCGALKNVVALAAGFVDALGLGNNTKAAVMRRGLLEMKGVADMYCAGLLGRVRAQGGRCGEGRGGDGCLPSPDPLTFLQSCGVADLVTTCYGGRNRKCAEEYARRLLLAPSPPRGGGEGDAGGVESAPTAPSRRAAALALWGAVEGELLGGGKMQGLATCLHVHALLEGVHLSEEAWGKHVVGRGGWVDGAPALAAFPLLAATHDIATGAASPTELFARL